jgi:hypothetical protein
MTATGRFAPVYAKIPGNIIPVDLIAQYQQALTEGLNRNSKDQ